MAYIVYFTPLLLLLWRRLHVSLFSRKQLWVLLFTLLLFGINQLWQWLLSPLFATLGTGLPIIIIEALLRTLFFALIAYVGIRRLHISSEVDNILRMKR